MAQCKMITKKGSRCKIPALRDSKLCFNHNRDGPAKGKGKEEWDASRKAWWAKQSPEEKDAWVRKKNLEWWDKRSTKQQSRIRLTTDTNTKKWRKEQNDKTKRHS